MKRAAPLVSIALAACSAIGDPGSMAEGLPHGGTGQFRPLEMDEIGGISGGRAIIVVRHAFDSAMVADGRLFYTMAPERQEPPVPPDDHPQSEVFWDAFGPRAIYRADPRDNPAFAAGPLIFEASEVWEGGEVFDPWVVIDEDGTARLYYAAEGGIGLAQASAADGAFARVGTGPILGADAAPNGAPRHPSVVRGPDGAWWMYYDAGGAIMIARSDDGISFARIDADESTPAIDPIAITGVDLREPPEISIGMPGAVTVETPAGRRIVRLYYESRRAEELEQVYVAGSEDGVHFERHEVPVSDNDDLRFPAPVALDARVTLLYANTVALTGGLQTRSVVVAVTPASVSFAPPEEEEEEE
jgi:hypothetical protein